MSFDGSNNSGVTVYQNGGLGYDYFGTSLASPCWAGLIAIANQGRVADGGTTLNSPANPTQTLQALYSLPASDFHDITPVTTVSAPGPATTKSPASARRSPISWSPTWSSYGLADQTGDHRASRPSASPPAQDFGLTVAVEDSSGDVITGYNGSVTIALANNPGGGTLGGTR